MKELSIIIVTYNAMVWLENCLDSCKGYPVIVVDNKSSDGTVDYIKSKYPEIVLLEQDQNLGFGQANNLGIKYALDHGANHVFLLNQDAYLLDNTVDELIAFQKSDPEYGILSPVHITGKKKTLDKKFSNYMLREKTERFYSDFVLGNRLASVYEVPFINAAAWLLSRKAIEVVGGFDPIFFHYGEDDNYCQRIQYHGFKIGVLPKVYIIHDREERLENPPINYSSEYYKKIDRDYRILFANINIESTLDSKAKALKKKCLRLFLKMKFQRAFAIKKELGILLKIKPLIQNSRTLNITKGTHYL